MNKEQIFDAKISPLVREIFDLCSNYGIAMVATFSIPTAERPDLCSFTSTPDGEGNMPDAFAEAIGVLRGQREAVVSGPSDAEFTAAIDRALASFVASLGRQAEQKVPA